MKPDAIHYVSQKAFIRDGETVLVLNDPVAGLDFPGGKLQEGEADLEAALRREVAEETGLEIEIGAPFIAWRDALHPITTRTGVPVLLVGYRCRLVGGEVRLSDEHDGFRWVARGDLAELDDGSTYFAALSAYFCEQT